MRKRTARGVAAVGLLLTTLGLLIDPASAAGGTLAAPAEVFTPVNGDLSFGIPDPFNGADRVMEVTGGDQAENCDHGTDPDDGEAGPVGGVNGDCYIIRFQVNHGTLTLTGVSGAGHPSGIEVVDATVLPSTNFGILGTLTEINAALPTLVYSPDNDYESTRGSDTENLHIDAFDGNDEDITAVGGGEIDITIRVEQPNDGPELTESIPDPVNVAAGGEAEFFDAVQLSDPDANDGEVDDVVLVVVWVDGVGQVDLAGFATPSCLAASGGAFTLGVCPNIPDGIETFIDAITALFPDGAFDGPFADVSHNVPSRAIAYLAETRPGGDDVSNTADDMLDHVTYTAPLTGDGDATVFMAVTDLGNNELPFGPGPTPELPIPDLGFAIDSFDVKVRDADNDPPVVTADPAGPTDILEGATLPLSFTVEDADADGGELTLTQLSVAGGALGGTVPAVPLDGSADALTAALAGLTFTADPSGGPGVGSVTAVVHDNGRGPIEDLPNDESGSGTATFSILEDGNPDPDPNPGVNDPPSIFGPDNVPATEAVPVNFDNALIGVSDPDAGPADDLTLTVTLVTGDGALSVGASPFTVDGTLGELNTALDGLTFTPADDVDADDESASILLEIDDNGHGPDVGPDLTADDTVNVVVDDDDLPNPVVNDAPVIAGPLNHSATEAVALILDDFTVTDSDLADGDGLMDLSITVPVLDGAVNNAGGTALTLAQVEAALDGLTFTPADDADTDAESVAIEIVVNDRGNFGTGGPLQDTHTVSVAVTDDDVVVPVPNLPPVLSVPGAQNVIEGGVLAFTGGTAVSVADPDAGAGAVDVDITAVGGTVQFGAGVPFTVGTTTGTLAQVNAALATLQFNAGVAGAGSVTFLADDNGNTGTGGALTDEEAVAITITPAGGDPNDPPVLTVPGAQVVVESGVLDFVDAAIGVTDPDAGGDDLTLTIGLDPGDTGTLSSTGATDDLVALNDLLDDLTYTPAADVDSNDTSATITITVDDLGNNGDGGNGTDDATIAVTVDDDTPPVGDVNDPPVLVVPSGLVVVSGGLVFFTGADAITLTDDADPAASDLVLHIESVGGSVNAGAVDLVGTMAELQAALSSLVFTSGAPGAATITITVNDAGNTGTGGSLSTTEVIDITVLVGPDGGTTTTTSTTTTTPGGATSSTLGGGVAGTGSGRGIGGSTLPRTGADLLLTIGLATMLGGLGALALTSRRRFTQPE